MAIKETVFLLLLVILPVAMESKEPAKPGISLKKLFASSSAKENDAGNGKSIQEQMKEDIPEIKDLVKQKRFRKKRTKILKLLDDLSTKVERFGGPIVPVQYSLGTLPEFPGQSKTYDLTAGGAIPPNAKAALVYVFVTTLGDGNFQRGWYEISTRQGRTEYSQFMNVATGAGLMAVNSDNMMFPFGEGTLKATLFPASYRKRSIAGKMADDDNPWSEVFIIGYIP